MKTEIRFIQIAVVVIVSVHMSLAFLLHYECIAEPCYCYDNTIDCSQAGPLYDIPPISPTILDGSSIIDLSNNFFQFIPSYVFFNVSVTNTATINMRLAHNELDEIETGALSTIGKWIIHLDMEDNKFTSIPTELADLTSLQSLKIRDNPLQSVDSGAFSGFGNTLEQLWITMAEFRTWPTTFNQLTALKELFMERLNLTTLDGHAFNGFENTLNRLIMIEMTLPRIPKAICHLTNLTDLSVYESSVLLTEPITQNCAVPSLQYLKISYNHLTHFPDVFSMFPSITTLDITSNDLSYIPKSMIPAQSKLKYLYLGGNKFTTIPPALNNLHNLEILQMMHDQVQSIADDDLVGLYTMKFLMLYGNPITHVSDNAFKNNTLLQRLDLSHSNLTSIPVSVTSLPSLKKLDMQSDNIHCDCNMTYLKSWTRVANISIGGYCAGGFNPVKDFITKSLSKCP